MALAPDQLGAATALLAACGRSNPIAQLRAQVPGIAVSRCDADDMRGEHPWSRSGDHLVYLIDTASHCWRIVGDPAEASGIVVALAP